MFRNIGADLGENRMDIRSDVDWRLVVFMVYAPKIPDNISSNF